MKPILYYFFSVFLYLIPFTISSQNQGRVYYKAEFIQTSSDRMKDIEKTKPFLYKKSVETDEKIAFLFKDTEFILKFKDDETTFKVAPTVAHDKDKFFPMLLIMTGTDGIIYQNLKTKEYIKQQKGFGKTYLIKEEPLDWRIHNESKKIGKYTCYKATAEVINKAVIEEKIIWNTTVWFTPEIPVASGPRGYGGLPGLILEANFNDFIHFFVTKLDLSPKKEVKIKKPVKGISISEEEFIELDRKAMGNFKSMKD